MPQAEGGRRADSLPSVYLVGQERLGRPQFAHEPAVDAPHRRDAERLRGRGDAALDLCGGDHSRPAARPAMRPKTEPAIRPEPPA